MRKQHFGFAHKIKELLTAALTGEDSLQTTVTLTNAQIKALPTTPVVIIPSTETLAYSGTPTKLFLPFIHAIILNTSAGGYTNVDVTAQFVLAFGSDWSADIARSQLIQGFLTATKFSFIPLLTENSAVSGKALPEPSGLTDGLQDNAVALAMTNGAAGNLTGGNVVNSMQVIVHYIEVII